MFWKMMTFTRMSYKKQKTDDAKRAKGELAKHEIQVSLLSDVGCQRTENEDRITCIQPTESSLLSHKGVLTVVADGMGGHAAGEVASSLAVEVIRRAYYEDGEDPCATLQKAFAQANREIYQTALQDSRLTGMGTTCTALVFRNGSAFCAHVGDSRVYLVRNGEIFLMTEDHTVVMEMVKSGLITFAEAQSHPERSVLSRALGTKPTVEVSIWKKPFPVRVSDVFVLCSDGLSDVVNEEEIKAAITQGGPSACANLITLAKERGGYDNITVGVLSVKPAMDDQSVCLADTRIG